jgi:hypothetical protein
MLPHDPQYKVGSRIRWGSGKMWKVTAIAITYQQIVANTTECAVQHCRALAMQGICAPMRLYHKPGALALQSEAITHSMESDGWTATDRLLQCNVPYEAYGRWITEHSRDLPIL